MPVPLKIPTFTAEEKDQLQRLERFDSNWRVRERVKTLLLLSEGQTCLEVAGKIGIHFRTVSYTRQGWLLEKFASLIDKPRCGAPLKMTTEERVRVVTWAETAPLSATELLAKHLDAGGTPVHAQTIKSLLRKEDFVWKRTRASLKKKEMRPLFVLPKLRLSSCAARPLRATWYWATSMRQAFPVSIPIEVLGQKWPPST